MAATLADSAPLSYLLTSLPNVAWILNLRGSDIAFSPLFYAYLLVGMEECVLWVQEGTLSDEATAQMEQLSVRVAPYDAIWEEIKGKKVRISQFMRIARSENGPAGRIDPGELGAVLRCCASSGRGTLSEPE